MYSRSVSGDGKEGPNPVMRVVSDGSVATVVRGPRNVEMRVQRPDVFVYGVNGEMTRRAGDDIDELASVVPLVVRKSRITGV